MFRHSHLVYILETRFLRLDLGSNQTLYTIHALYVTHNKFLNKNNC